MNIDNIISNISTLNRKSIFSALEIYSMGNKIYFLKDRNNKLFILVVPNKRLNNIQVATISKFGYKEIWPKINFNKTINFPQTKEELMNLAIEIKNIFNKLFIIPESRIFRSEINSGMAVIKDTSRAITPRSEVSIRKKKKFILKKYIKVDDISSLIGAGVFIIILAINGAIKANTLWLPIVIILVMLLLGRILSVFEIKAFRKKRFLNNSSTIFFQQFGFKKAGNRYRKTIQGYRVELLYNQTNQYHIIVYHQEISWNKVLKMPNTGFLSRYGYDWAGQFFSIKYFDKKISKSKLIDESEKFVNYIIKLKLEPAATTTKNR